MRMRRTAVALLFTAAMLTVHGAAAQARGPIYIVQPGDTLTDIAFRFGTTIESLSAVNSLTDLSTLVPGQELVIPGFEGIEGVLTTRSVEFGETVRSLSLRHGVSRDSLLRLNRVLNPARLYVGQAIVLPEGQADAPLLPRSRAYLVNPGESLLEVAVREGLNPWNLAATREGRLITWWIPGSALHLSGGDTPTRELPTPIVAVNVRPVALVQGRTAVIELGLDSPAWAEGALANWNLSFHQLDELDLVALQGVNALVEPGLYDLRIDLYASDGGTVTYSFSQPVRVRSGGYGFDPVLNVPEETLDPANIEPEEALFASIVGQVSPDKLWEGQFEFPSNYFTESFPSVFGTRRNYNNTGYNFYHTGLDFYGGTGLPILAPARGMVVFADELKVRGNTTILDHGWGIFTVYMHQSEILVNQGDAIARGETIGLVGATGRVTGPHLHWEVLAGGVPVEPLEWVQAPFP